MMTMSGTGLGVEDRAGAGPFSKISLTSISRRGPRWQKERESLLLPGCPALAGMSHKLLQQGAALF
jgi:hypothetical protein